MVQIVVYALFDDRPLYEPGLSDCFYKSGDILEYIEYNFTWNAYNDICRLQSGGHFPASMFENIVLSCIAI